jgi:TP901 family phage tail tape measure protein
MLAFESENDLSGSVGLDTTAFKAGVSDLKAQVKQIETSFRASAAVMGDWSKSTEGLGTRTTSLKDKLKLQKQALTTLNEEYKKTVSEQGANSKSAQSLANQMYSMEKQINSTEKDLKKYNDQLKLQSSGFEQLHLKMQSVGKQAKAVGNGFASFGKSMTAKVTAPIVAVGVAASKMGMDFEKSSAKVSTIADTASVSMASLKKGVLALSSQTGESASDLNEALYQTISAGVKTGDAMQFLGTATKLAKGGFTDSQTAIDALTTTINAYGLKASDATKISDQLIQTQNLGKTTVAELGGAIGNVIPIAASMNVSTQDLFASLAELTKNGVKTDEAVTGMKSALSSILSPSASAAKAAKQMGINFSEAHLKNVGWPAFLQEIQEKTGGSSEKMAELFGNVRALNAVTILAGKGSSDFKTVLQQMGNTAGLTDSAFAKMEDNGAAKWQKAVNKMKNAGIKLGESLTPLVTKISDAVSKLADKFNSLSPAQQGMIINFAKIAALIGPIILILGKMVISVSAIAGAIGTFSGALAVVQTGAAAATPAIAGLSSAIQFMTGPIGLAILAVTAAVTVVTILWNKCAGFRNFWTGLWAGIQSAAQSVGAWFSGPFVQFFQSAGNGIKSFFTGIPAFFAGIWSSIQTMATTAWNAISSAVMAIITPFVAAIQGPFDTLKSGLSNIMSGIQSIFTGVWTVIKNVVLGIVLIFIDLITGDFSKLHSDLTGILNNIKNAFSTIWNGIKSVVTGIAQALVGTLGTIFRGGVAVLQTIGNGLKTFFTGLWTGIKNTAVNMFNSLLGFFSTLPSKFSGFMHGVGDAIIHGFDSAIDFIKNLPTQMLQWGKDMIQGLIDGIKSMVGKVGDAVKEVGNTIRRHLHFSAPDEGPLADYETWMPDFMQGLADGINANKYKVVSAMRSLAADMSIAPTVHPAYAGGYSAPASVAASGASSSYTFYQYNNSPKALSPAETARQTRNLLRQARLQSRK